MPRLQVLASISIAVALAVLGLKYAAYYLTGSVALFSDAVESIINLVTAGMTLYAIHVSAKPADRDHPYGHQKAEYFSAVVEGVLIIIGAVLILRESYLAFMAPRMPEATVEGLVFNGLATLLNGGWALALLREAGRRRSPALKADGRHLLADVYTSAGVIVGLALAVATGWAVLDPVLAGFVALNILWSGWQLVRESVGGLMDEALAPKAVERIREAISTHAEGAIEAHDLRTRYAGRRTFIDFHLVVPGTMSVSDAHDICDAIERALRAEADDALITIHVEPENKAKHQGIVVL
jgi:cation diffusion facilitator family transporter